MNQEKKTQILHKKRFLQLPQKKENCWWVFIAMHFELQNSKMLLHKKTTSYILQHSLKYIILSNKIVSHHSNLIVVPFNHTHHPFLCNRCTKIKKKEKD